MQDDDQNIQELFDALDRIPELVKDFDALNASVRELDALKESVRELIRIDKQEPSFSSSQVRTLRSVMCDELNSALSARLGIPKPPKEKDGQKKYKWGCFVIALVLCLGFYLPIFLATGVVKDKNAIGQEYVEISRSEYVTEEERELLERNTNPISLLPGEYEEDPEGVRKKIRQNRKEIKRRKKEAERNGGRWSVGTRLLR